MVRLHPRRRLVRCYPRTSGRFGGWLQGPPFAAVSEVTDVEWLTFLREADNRAADRLTPNFPPEPD